MALCITLAERKSSRAGSPRNPYPLNDAEDSESLAFGVGPLRPIGADAAEVVACLHWRLEVKRLHRLGARAIGEAWRP